MIKQRATVTAATLACVGTMALTGAFAGANGTTWAGQETTSRVDTARIIAASPSDWLSHGRTYDEQRFSPLAQIDYATVGQVGLAWYADLNTAHGQEGTPLVIDGVIYITTAWPRAIGVHPGRRSAHHEPCPSPWTRPRLCSHQRNSSNQ